MNHQIIKRENVHVAPVRRLCESSGDVSIFVEAVPSDKAGLELAYEVDVRALNFKGLKEHVARDIANQINGIIRRAERETK